MTTPLSWEYLHTTPGIYTFLGLATLPRFRTQSNNLRILPRVIIDRIARGTDASTSDTARALWRPPPRPRPLLSLRTVIRVHDPAP